MSIADICMAFPKDFTVSQDNWSDCSELWDFSEPGEWVWADRAVEVKVGGSHEMAPFASLNGVFCPWKCFDIRLSLPVWLFSAHTHSWTLGRAWRRKNPCLHLYPFISQVPGIHASCLSSAVCLRAWRQTGRGWASQEVIYSTSKEESTHWWQFLQLLSAWSCQRRTWSDHPYFCDSFSLKRPFADLKSLSTAASPWLCFCRELHLYLCKPSSVSFIFTCMQMGATGQRPHRDFRDEGLGVLLRVTPSFVD